MLVNDVTVDLLRVDKDAPAAKVHNFADATTPQGFF